MGEDLARVRMACTAEPDGPPMRPQGYGPLVLNSDRLSDMKKREETRNNLKYCRIMRKKRSPCQASLGAEGADSLPMRTGVVQL